MHLFVSAALFFCASIASAAYLPAAGKPTTSQARLAILNELQRQSMNESADDIRIVAREMKSLKTQTPLLYYTISWNQWREQEIEDEQPGAVIARGTIRYREHCEYEYVFDTLSHEARELDGDCR